MYNIHIKKKKKKKKYVVSWRSAVKYLSKLDIRISQVFIRLILPVFFGGLFLVPRTLNFNEKS